MTSKDGKKSFKITSLHHFDKIQFNSMCLKCGLSFKLNGVAVIRTYLKKVSAAGSVTQSLWKLCAMLPPSLLLEH